MNANEFARKIFSLRLWGNLFAMIIVVILLCFGVKLGLDMYTHHGEEIEIPDLRNKSFADAEHILNGMGLDIVVRDTGYVKTKQPDCILQQQPEAGQRVKSGRVVYVMINSAQSRMLTLPDIIENCSYREAKARLIAMGFKVGPPQYMPGEKDWVYGVKSRGRMLANGQKTAIDDMLIIQVGDGLRDESDPFVYADPDDFGTVTTDSLGNPITPHERFDENNAGGGDIDEFEVVTSPAQ